VQAVHGEAPAPGGRGGRGPARGHRRAKSVAARWAQPGDLPPRQVRPSGSGETRVVGRQPGRELSWANAGEWLGPADRALFVCRRPPRSGSSSFACSRRSRQTTPRSRPPRVSPALPESPTCSTQTLRPGLVRVSWSVLSDSVRPRPWRLCLHPRGTSSAQLCPYLVAALSSCPSTALPVLAPFTWVSMASPTPMELCSWLDPDSTTHKSAARG
jgi:hypothetical protein